MAKKSVARPFAERDLRDEPRLDPVDPSALGQRGRERACGLLERGELRFELLERLVREAGPDAPAIAQLPSGFVDAEEQRAESCARAGGVGEAADDELLAAEALRLEPRAVAAAAVGGVPALGHDAFEAGLARFA